MTKTLPPLTNEAIMKIRQQVIRVSFVAAAAAIFLSLVGVVGRSEPANVKTASPPVNQGLTLVSEVVNGWAIVQPQDSTKEGFFSPASGSD